MILDVIVIFVLLAFMFFGFKNGFVRTLFNSFGWILAIVFAIFLNDGFRNLLRNYTTIFDKLLLKADDVIGNLLDKHLDGSDYNLPSIVTDGIDKVNDAITTELASKFAEAAFIIFAFILLLIILKLVFYIITILLSKRFHRGFVGGIDGIFGSILGIFQGGIAILVVLAIITPATLLINPNWYSWVSTSLDESIFTAIIYENNPLRIIVDNYVPEEFIPSFESSDIKDLLPDVTNLR